ncbi:MAG TPA: transcriptional initiation protein Tat [Acidocella sp.]|nr:transcriptional initiation protein Tat [Acidocella sp.]
MTENNQTPAQPQRRNLLRNIGLSVGTVGLVSLAGKPALAQAAASGDPSLIPSGATTLQELTARLTATPRRRDFKTVPMILTSKDQWDDQAINELIAYQGDPKQVWDNTALEGPWLNLMRNAVNTQNYSFKKPDYLAVSITHAAAHLALFDETLWDKYKLGALVKNKSTSNTFILTPSSAATDPKNFNDPTGVFSPEDNSVTVLQRRGVVFMGCHNAIWEISGKILKSGVNPDKLTHPEIAAEFTNHLIPGAVLTPGVVGTMVYLQKAGYEYAVGQ